MNDSSLFCELRDDLLHPSVDDYGVSLLPIFRHFSRFVGFQFAGFRFVGFRFVRFRFRRRRSDTRERRGGSQVVADAGAS